jgi:hypothetical protein
MALWAVQCFQKFLHSRYALVERRGEASVASGFLIENVAIPLAESTRQVSPYAEGL